MVTTDDLLKKSKGFIEDAIDDLYSQYRKTKGRKERSELRVIYEDLVRMDTRRCGFRRYVQLR